jgi:hypothetical protein
MDPNSVILLDRDDASDVNSSVEATQSTQYEPPIDSQIEEPVRIDPAAESELHTDGAKRSGYKPLQDKHSERQYHLPHRFDEQPRVFGSDTAKDPCVGGCDDKCIHATSSSSSDLRFDLPLLVF